MKASRVGDYSWTSDDSHGCPICPHGAAGPATTGSPNVLVNSKPALRVGDRGIHSGCCGSNIWKAIQGSPRVLINDKKAHRMGDVDQHCGGTGRMIQGSPNVLIGNYVSSEASENCSIRIKLQDMPGPDGAPLMHVPWALFLDWRLIETGVTDENGDVAIETKLKPHASYELHYSGRSMEICADSAVPVGTIKGCQARLAILGYYPGHITGRMQQATSSALLDFQFDHELPVTGACDEMTQAKLVEVAGW